LKPTPFPPTSGFSPSFEEFKGVYNAAVDDCAGTKPKPRPQRTWRKQDGPLGSEATDDERALFAEHTARSKAEESERIRRKIAELKAQLMTAHNGKDPKGAEKELFTARKEAMKERARRRAEDKARIAAENTAMRARLRGVEARVDDDAYDDAVDVDGDGMADMSVADARRAMAAESEAARGALAGKHERNGRELVEMRERAQSKVDTNISDDPAGVARAEIAALKEELSP
jgi:hypothetical protein